MHDATFSLLRLFKNSKLPCNEIRNYFTDDNDVELINANRIGPDEILVQLEGSTMQTEVAESVDLCGDYSATFQMPLGGHHRLKIFRTRSDYTSVRLDPWFPKMKYEILLDELLLDPLVSYAPYPCSATVPGFNGYWISNVSSHLLNNKDVIWVKNSCSHGDEKRGLRIYTHIDLDENNQKMKCASDVQFYNWNREICLDGYNSAEHSLGNSVSKRGSFPITVNHPTSTTFKGKSILFVGDSHMRGLADVFLYHVCEFESHGFFEKDTRTEEGKKDLIELNNDGYPVPSTVAYVTKKFLKSDNENFIRRARKQHSTDYRQYCRKNPADRDCNLYHRRCEGTNFGYMSAMFCQPGVLDYFKDYDFIVINCGHHPAAASEYSFRYFRSFQALYSHTIYCLLIHFLIEFFCFGLENTGNL